MSEFTCFKCGDGNTPLYCLNCANEMNRGELAPATGSGFLRAIRKDEQRLQRRLALQKRLRRKKLPERPLNAETIKACFPNATR